MIRLFIILSTFFVLLGWVGLILTEFNIYYSQLIYLFLAVGLFITIKYRAIILKAIEEIKSSSFITFFSILFIFFISLFNTFYAHETILGQRDDGVYSNSANYLVEKHTLKISGSLSINYPGWTLKEGNYLPVFNYGYIVWTAIYKSLFSYKGLFYSNFIPSVLGLLSFLLITNLLVKKNIGIISVILFSTNFAFFWFSRRTLSEIFSFFLVWFSIYTLLLCIRHRNNFYLICSIITLGYFLHTRPEAFFSAILYGLVLVYLYLHRIILFKKLTFLLLVIIILHYGFYSLLIQPTYYQGSASNLTQLAISAGIRSEEQLTSESLYRNLPNFILRVFNQYNYTPYIIFTLILLLNLFLISKFKEKESYYYLVVLIIIAPTFIYLIHPAIYFDQPWMLRRYFYTLIPFFILSCTLFLFKTNIKNRVFIIALMILINLVLSYPIIFLKEFNNSYNQIQNISQMIPQDSIILINRWALDSNGKGLETPLFFVFGRNSYLITPPNYEDVKVLIKNNPNKDFYVIINNKDVWYNKSIISNFEPSLSFFSSNQFIFDELDKTCEIFRGIPEDLWPKLNYKNFVIPSCFNLVPSSVIHQDYQLLVYRLNKGKDNRSQ